MKRLVMLLSLGLIIFTLSACDNDHYTIGLPEDIVYNIGDTLPEYDTFFTFSHDNKGASISEYDDSLVNYNEW